MSGGLSWDWVVVVAAWAWMFGAATGARVEAKWEKERQQKRRAAIRKGATP